MRLEHSDSVQPTIIYNEMKCRRFDGELSKIIIVNFKGMGLVTPKKQSY